MKHADVREQAGWAVRRLVLATPEPAYPSDEEIADAVLAASASAIAKQIRRELVCCDVYENRNKYKVNRIDHASCFWGEASARLVEELAGLREPE